MPPSTPIKGRRRRGGGLIIILQPRLALLLKEIERLKLYEEIMCETATPLTEEEMDGYATTPSHGDALAAIETAASSFASTFDANITALTESHDIAESNLP